MELSSPLAVWGKTWLGLLIAEAVATGGHVGEWKALAPAKVLYINGEMPVDLIRDRDKGLGSGEVEFLNHAILFDRTEKVLNITEPPVQHAILQKCIRSAWLYWTIFQLSLPGLKRITALNGNICTIGCCNSGVTRSP